MSAPGWATLDYPRAQIMIRAVSQWEQSFRAHACAKEPWTVEWIESMPQDALFWDIGANTGPYALIAGMRGVTTFAFEPGYANYQALCDNVLANPTAAPRIVPLAIALAEGTGLVPFFYRNLEPGAASHSMGAALPKAVAQLPALAMRADVAMSGFGLPCPTHVKLDVDGAEQSVLRGFGERLREVREIMVEVPNGGMAAESIRNLLGAAGFAHAATFDRRDGQTIGEIHYEKWGRT